VVVPLHRLQFYFISAAGEYTRSAILSGINNWDDGNDHRILFTVDGNTALDIYIDGVVVSAYDTFSQQTGATGFTDTPSTVDTLTIGNASTQDRPMRNNTRCSQWDFWKGSYLLAADALEDFNNEQANIGEGFIESNGVLLPVLEAIYDDGDSIYS